MENYLPIIIGLGFLVVFPILWCGIVFLTASLGGWRSLAEQFPVPSVLKETKPKKIYSATSLKINLLGNYSGIIEAKLYSEGILLTTGPFFKFGHPSIFLPKNRITHAKMGKILFRTFLHLGIRNKTLTFYGTASEGIFQWYKQTSDTV